MDRKPPPSSGKEPPSSEEEPSPSKRTKVTTSGACQFTASDHDNKWYGPASDRFKWGAMIPTPKTTWKQRPLSQDWHEETVCPDPERKKIHYFKRPDVLRQGPFPWFYHVKIVQPSTFRITDNEKYRNILNFSSDPQYRDYRILGINQEGGESADIVYDLIISSTSFAWLPEPSIRNLTSNHYGVETHRIRQSEAYAYLAFFARKAHGVGPAKLDVTCHYTPVSMNPVLPYESSDDEDMSVNVSDEHPGLPPHRIDDNDPSSGQPPIAT